MSTTTIVPVTSVPDAYIVFTLLKPVAVLRREQQELIGSLESIAPSSAADHKAKLASFEEEVRTLGLSDADKVFVAPTEFHVRSTGQLLPKGAFVVGWLDADGYRQVEGTPLPDDQWLVQAAASLEQWSQRTRSVS